MSASTHDPFSVFDAIGNNINSKPSSNQPDQFGSLLDTNLASIANPVPQVTYQAGSIRVSQMGGPVSEDDGFVMGGSVGSGLPWTTR
jgi:hypothetical protein